MLGVVADGDLGHYDPASSSTVMPYVSRDVLDGPPCGPRGAVDMVLHVGDFAYDFDSDSGNTGRYFMQDISNYSAYVPYMISHGAFAVAVESSVLLARPTPARSAIGSHLVSGEEAAARTNV